MLKCQYHPFCTTNSKIPNSNGKERRTPPSNCLQWPVLGANKVDTAVSWWSHISSSKEKIVTISSFYNWTELTLNHNFLSKLVSPLMRRLGTYKGVGFLSMNFSTFEAFCKPPKLYFKKLFLRRKMSAICHILSSSSQVSPEIKTPHVYCNAPSLWITNLHEINQKLQTKQKSTNAPDIIFSGKQ